MGCDLAAYRVVQEALTNALKHAGAGAHAKVLRALDARSELELDITDTGTGSPPPARTSTGRSDRASSACASVSRCAAATLQAGPRFDGGFRVRATIPKHREAA